MRRWGRVSPLFREVLVLRFQEQMKLGGNCNFDTDSRRYRKNADLSRRSGAASVVTGRTTMTAREHERALDLINAARNGRDRRAGVGLG